MNSSTDNIIVNSCQYTPVYVIENPSVAQTRSYVIAQTSPSVSKPVVSDNLKRFYENSGKLENNLLTAVETAAKPRILRKQESNVIGNNLKLASFLIPKNDTNKHIITPVNNVILKPVVISNTSVQNTVPKLDISSKIVKLKDLSQVNYTPKSHSNGKVLPKIKPKEIAPNPSKHTPVQLLKLGETYHRTPNITSHTTSKHTSVQLLKLGETYHSLNQLSDDQMKIVNHALKIFNDPQKTIEEPAYDPVTNTQFIYKIVSPKDLTVVGKNKMVLKQKKDEVKKEVLKKPEKKEPKHVFLPEDSEDDEPICTETKVTRSGRKVKLPKNILPEETPQKPRKRSGTTVTCFQCSCEFSSLYRLERHYENHPTHIPSRIHSNLFHCLLAIIKSGSEKDSANIFIQQLEQLIAKIKSLLPCLLKKDGVDGKMNTINDDVGRLFGMDPGKYNLNMDALSCVKDKDGYCEHNPQPAPDPTKPSQLWLSKHNEEKKCETDDCARINSAEKWPTVSKKLEARKQKQAHQPCNPKKMRMEFDPEPPMTFGMDELVALLNTDTETDPPQLQPEPDKTNAKGTEPAQDIASKDPNPLIQFHSAHFDIRSSPIKPSSAVFQKFQIDPAKIAKYEPRAIRPLTLDQDSEFGEMELRQSTETQPQDIYKDNMDLPCKETEQLSFNNIKDWSKFDISNDQNFMKSNSLINEQSDSFKSNSVIEPSLIHLKNESVKEMSANEVSESDQVSINDIRLSSSQGQSVLNFLESLGNECLSYPETAIRNNPVDFQLDLFPFNHS